MKSLRKSTTDAPFFDSCPQTLGLASPNLKSVMADLFKKHVSAQCAVKKVGTFFKRRRLMDMEKIKNQKIRVVGYIRVSTGEQADKGHSLEAQRTKLSSYADLFELEIVRFEVDTASASTLERPGLKAALAALDAFEATGILVMKLDRLTRSVRDLCSLTDTYFRDGAYNLMSVGEQIDTRTAVGRMILNVVMSIAQWERETISERTTAVMQHMKSTGRYTGGCAPYGYVLDEGRLVSEPSEQAIISMARELHGRGNSLRAVAVALGNNPRTGRAFQATQIVRMI